MAREGPRSGLSTKARLDVIQQRRSCTRVDLGTVELLSWDVDGTLYSVTRMKWWLAALALREFFVGRGAGIGRDLKTLERHRASVRATRSRGGIISNELSDLERQTLHAAEQRWYGAAIARTGSRPGVAKLLERLAVRRIPQVVISDFEAAYKLDALGLGDYFNTTYCGDSLGFVKPSPRLFEQAAADFGIEPHQLLHIGDRADTDDVAAVTAGCQCLVLGRDFPNFDALADELAAPPARFKT